MDLAFLSIVEDVVVPSAAAAAASSTSSGIASSVLLASQNQQHATIASWCWNDAVKAELPSLRTFGNDSPASQQLAQSLFEEVRIVHLYKSNLVAVQLKVVSSNSSVLLFTAVGKDVVEVELFLQGFVQACAELCNVSDSKLLTATHIRNNKVKISLLVDEWIVQGRAEHLYINPSLKHVKS